MVRRVRVAYLLVFFGLLVAGFFIEAPWWAKALIGIAVMGPIAIADIVTSRKRLATRPVDA